MPATVTVATASGELPSQLKKPRERCVSDSGWDCGVGSSGMALLAAGDAAAGAGLGAATAAPAAGAMRLPSGKANVTYMRCPAIASRDSSALSPPLLARTVCRPGIMYTAY